MFSVVVGLTDEVRLHGLICSECKAHMERCVPYQQKHAYVCVNERETGVTV